MTWEESVMDLSTTRERILGTGLAKALPEGMRTRFGMIVLWVAEPRDVSRQERLFTLGDQDGSEGCVVLEGMLTVITEDGRRKNLEAPDVLGEVQLIMPKRTRTATVEVLIGGTILQFNWNTFAGLAEKLYTPDEMETLKKIIGQSAWNREANMAEKIERQKD